MTAGVRDRRRPAQASSEARLWIAGAAVALAAHAVGGALFLPEKSPNRPRQVPAARPVAVWGYIPPLPPPRGASAPAHRAPGAEEWPGARRPGRAPSLEIPPDAHPAAPIATEPLVEPTAAITPSAAGQDDLVLVVPGHLPPPPPVPVALEGIASPEPLPDTQKKPRYPEAARRLRLEASVLLQVLVREDGTVGEVTVLRCTRPRVGFEEAALEAVRQWRFRPATVGGQPVAATVTVKVDFGP